MLKRVFDVAAAATGLLLLAPLLLMLAVAIKLDSPGPVFYRQQRVGRHGRTFRIFKFRTMADAPLATGFAGPQLTVQGDARITRVGAFLRHYKLDELPQLIDVLRGTMSLVGPRPEVPRYVAHYPPAWRAKVLSVRPGITDTASLRFRAENELLARAADPEREYIDVILPTKLRHAVEYVDGGASVAGDLRVLGATLHTVFVGDPSTRRRFSTMNDSRFWAAVDRALARPWRHGALFRAAADASTVLLCWHLTYLFRLGFERWQPGRPWYDDVVSFGVVAVYLVCLALAGVPRGIWRYFGFDDLKRITVACLAAGLISAVAVLMAQLTGVARAVLLLHPLFCIAALSVVRMACRMVWEHARLRANGLSSEPRRAIVLGAGDAARRLIAGIHLRDGWTVLGLLDDDASTHGQRFAGIPVLGGLAELAMPHVRAGATHVIVAMPGESAARRGAALAAARASGLSVLSVPDETELRAERTA